MDEIKRVDIRGMLLELYGRGLSLSTINLVKCVIIGTLNFAVDGELIEANPDTV